MVMRYCNGTLDTYLNWEPRRSIISRENARA